MAELAVTLQTAGNKNRSKSQMIHWSLGLLVTHFGILAGFIMIRKLTPPLLHDRLNSAPFLDTAWHGIT